MSVGIWRLGKLVPLGILIYTGSLENTKLDITKLVFHAYHIAILLLEIRI